MRRFFLTAVTLFCIFAVALPVMVAQEAAQTIPITSIGFGAKLSPDGKTLVTFDNPILMGIEVVDPATLPMQVIDISTGEKVGELTGHTDYAYDVAFTSDGSQMVSVHSNGDVLLWNTADWSLAQTYQTLILGLQQVKLLPDDTTALILVLGTPQRLMIMDTTTGAITGFIGRHFDSMMEFQAEYNQFPGSGDLMFAGLAVSPDGTLVATATANDEVGLWTVADNAYQRLKEPFEKFGLFSIRALAFTPDGKSLVYYDTTDKQTHIWDVEAGTERSLLAIGSDTFALSPDGTMIAWGTRGDGSTISVAPLDAPETATVVLDVPEGLRLAPRVTWLAFTPDGSQLVVGGFFAPDGENQIYVLDVP